MGYKDKFNKNLKNLELTDGVITLKPFKLKDAALHLAGEDEEQKKWLSGGKSTIKSVGNWIKKNSGYWKRNGPVYNLAIWVGSNLIGMVEANTDENKIEGMKKGQANISYGIYHKYRGRGYAAKAVSLFLKILKLKGITHALIRVNPKNTNSLRIPIKCNFRETGEIKTKDGNYLRLFIKDL
ncbi:MAG TPA: GNAT family N-acetyltransferase [Candidatus Nanoarchaeia archaeon]|nr:GNAT family N-acetyltransferase [Candidatus Nanoarchaeia archaeon]